MTIDDKALKRPHLKNSWAGVDSLEMLTGAIDRIAEKSFRIITLVISATSSPSTLVSPLFDDLHFSLVVFLFFSPAIQLYCTLKQYTTVTTLLPQDLTNSPPSWDPQVRDFTTSLSSRDFYLIACLPLGNLDIYAYTPRVTQNSPLVDILSLCLPWIGAHNLQNRPSCLF